MKGMRIISGLLLVLALGFVSCSDDDSNPHEEDIAVIDSFLSDNSINAQTTDSGVRYVITQGGSGGTPQNGTRVYVNYTGYTLDSTYFDTSIEAVAIEKDIHNAQRLYQPLQFMVGRGDVIQGFNDGVKQLNVGAKATIFMPSTLAYGTDILVFDVEMLDMGCDLFPLTIREEQLVKDSIAIDAYLQEHNIIAETHPSGVRYVINDAGSGISPDLCDIVSVTYEGKIMDTGNVFETRVSPVDYFLDQLIQGWYIGLPLIAEEGSITLYIPSVYGYGSAGSGSIPGDANLIFTIDLVEVK